MRILMTGQLEIPAKIGIGLRMWEFCKNLKKSGHEITILCSKRGKQKSFEKIDGIKVYRVPEFRKPTRWLAILMVPWLFFNTIKLCWKEKIDIVHGQADVGTFSALLSKPFIGKRKILYGMDGLTLEEFTISGLAPKNSIREKLVKFVVKQNMQKTDAVIVVSEYQGQVVKKIAPKQTTFAVPNAANLKIFNTKTKQKKLEKPAVLHVGYLEGWAKGDFILESAKIVAKSLPNVKFYFLGKGPKLAEIKQMTKKEKLEKNVKFLGFVPYKEVPKYIKGADVCLVMLPKGDAGDIALPLKVFEYMAMEKPIIGSDTKELKKFFQKYKTGIASQPAPEKYAQAVKKLLLNKKLREKMGKNGKKAVKTEFNWVFLSKKLEAFYQKLLL